MTRIKGKKQKSEFKAQDCYAVVEGFQMFQDIPSNMEMHESPLTGADCEKIASQSTQHEEVDEPSINLAQNSDEVPPNPNVRPIERKATKEAARKGKKAAKDACPMTSAVVTIATNQSSILQSREKRDEAYAKQLQEQQQREYMRLQMDLRNEHFKLQEREDRIKEREEKIMEVNPSTMSPGPRKDYWRLRQK